MTTYEIIADLCSKHGIAITALEKELGFGRGYIGKFRTKGTSPTIKKLQQIADYFNVTVDYLTNGDGEDNKKYYLNQETEETAQEIFEKDKVLFDVYRSADKDKLVEYAKMLKALRDAEEGR